MGKLMHATIGIPKGCGPLSPIIATVATKSKIWQYKDNKTKIKSGNKTGKTGSYCY